MNFISSITDFFYEFSFYNYLIVCGILLLLICLGRGLLHIYNVAVSPSAVQIVKLRKQFTVYRNNFPFEVDFDLRACSLSNGVVATLKSNVPAYTRGFWGMSIQQLYAVMQVNQTDFKSAVLNNNPPLKYAFAHDPVLLLPNQRKTLAFKSSVVWNENINCCNSQPRHQFPFVLITVVVNEEIADNNSVISDISILHIPDNDHACPPYVLGTYVKLSSGHVGPLKEIYISSSTDDEGICVVCYQNPVTKVLLPCRHACLCNNCFKMCETCPVCRAHFNHYFDLDE